MAFISVVIPCYNSENYIKRCLEALEGQTYSDFEVILTDDCSTDKTAETIVDFKKTHHLNMQLIKNEKNSGPAVSRNKAIEEANGKYIAFCDSDDRYDENYLELMAAAAAENDADMVFCNSKKVLASGKAIDIKLFEDAPQNMTVKDALAFGIDSLWCLMVKREIILKTPLPDIRNGEDMAVIPLMIMNSQRFAAVEKPIYNYFCNSGSLSNAVNEKVVKSLEKSFEYIYKNRSAEYDTEIELIGVKNIVYGALLNHFKYSSDKKEAKEILQRFENKYPDWNNNKYISQLPFAKRLFVKLAKGRCFCGLKLLSFAHKTILG